MKTQENDQNQFYVICLKGVCHADLKGIAGFKKVDDLNNYARNLKLYDYEIKSSEQLTTDELSKVEQVYEWTFAGSDSRLIIYRFVCKFCGFIIGGGGECTCRGIDVRDDRSLQVFDVR